MLDNSLKHIECVSPLGAICAIIHGSYGKESSQFPQIDMMIILDILSTLARSGRLTSKQLGNVLNSRPNRDTIRKNLKILIEMRLVSVDRMRYRGVARAKNFFEVTEKGSEYVLATGRILSG